jgi:death-on-curing protein
LIAYLELADYLLIAESVLGVPAEAIANFDRIGLAQSALAAPQGGFGGVEAYPDFETKAAVLCWHLVKNHPLPDGNKRCAFLATVELSSGTGEPGCRHRAIRSRPMMSFAASRAAT